MAKWNRSLKKGWVKAEERQRTTREQDEGRTPGGRRKGGGGAGNGGKSAEENQRKGWRKRTGKKENRQWQTALHMNEFTTFPNKRV